MASGDDEKKHELHTAWAVWEQRELGKGMAYADKLFKLCSFRTVEEFWSYWNNIPKPRCVAYCSLYGCICAYNWIASFACGAIRSILTDVCCCCSRVHDL